MDGTERNHWATALLEHEREIERLRLEIETLERERDACHESVVAGILRLQIELANAQLTRHRIGAALMSARLRSPA